MTSEEDQGVDGRPAWVADIATDQAPPASVRAEVVSGLRQQGFFRASRDQRMKGWAIRAVAALVLFTAGWQTHAVRLATTSRPANTPEFVFLLFGGAATPGDEARRVAEYTEWARTLARNGRRISGERLGHDRVVIGRPLSDAAPDLSGFFIVEAASATEATALAEAHPHVKEGGSIVIRHVEH